MTVICRTPRKIPLFLRADRTRSEASFVYEARNPTMVNMGRPSETSVSTVTFRLEMPSMKAEVTVLYMGILLVKERMTYF